MFTRLHNLLQHPVCIDFLRSAGARAFVPAAAIFRQEFTDVDGRRAVEYAVSDSYVSPRGIVGMIHDLDPDVALREQRICQETVSRFAMPHPAEIGYQHAAFHVRIEVDSLTVFMVRDHVFRAAFIHFGINQQPVEIIAAYQFDQSQPIRFVLRSLPLDGHRNQYVAPRVLDLFERQPSRIDLVGYCDKLLEFSQVAV